MNTKDLNSTAMVDMYNRMLSQQSIYSQGVMLPPPLVKVPDNHAPMYRALTAMQSCNIPVNDHMDETVRLVGWIKTLGKGGSNGLSYTVIEATEDDIGGLKISTHITKVYSMALLCDMYTKHSFKEKLV